MKFQKLKHSDWDRLAHSLLYLTLGAGLLLRIVVWLQNRSLFIDEANLARNFCEMSWANVFQPLGYEQYAPPLFLAVQKAAVLLLGQQEYALRLFPLICGLASVFLFYRIARRLISSPWVCLAVVWIFCFSSIFLRYATEGKQYGCDLAVALGLILFSLAHSQRPFRPFWAAGIGAVAIWLSMPAVFVLFGAGLFFLQKYWSENDRRGLLQTAGAVLVWLLSFAGYYWLMLRPTLAVAPLVHYHQGWFFPLLPGSAAEWIQARDLLLTFPYHTAGFTVLAQITGIAGILTGLFLALRYRKDLAFLLAVPVLACVLASGFEKYSLISRMLLWAFPLVLLLQGLGWQKWWTAGRAWYLRVGMLLLFAATAGLHLGWQHLIRPFQIEEIRPVLEAVGHDFQADDVLYVSHEAWPAVAYYRDCHAQRARYQFDNRVLHGNWDEQPTLEKLSAFGEKPRRIWLLYSHLVSEQSRQTMQADLEQVGRFAAQKKVVEMEGAYGYLYVLR